MTTSSRSSLPPRGEMERSIRSAMPARWVMAYDMALVAGPPEIHGGGGTNFKWIVPKHLRGLVRSIPTPKGRPQKGALFNLVGSLRFAVCSIQLRNHHTPTLDRNRRHLRRENRAQLLLQFLGAI